MVETSNEGFKKKVYKKWRKREREGYCFFERRGYLKLIISLRLLKSSHIKSIEIN